MTTEVFNLVAHLERQRAFSLETFGPGERLAGVLAHIRKELGEIEAKPTDIMEWADLLLLSFDGAWRQGFEPGDIVAALAVKQAINEQRDWPDWRTAAPDQPIEHVRADIAAVSHRKQIIEDLMAESFELMLKRLKALVSAFEGQPIPDGAGEAFANAEATIYCAERALKRKAEL